LLLLTAIKNLSKDKTVSTRSLPSARGSNDTNVIVDGDRDGKMTATPIQLGNPTNSQAECTACYISTSTDVNIWIRIDLVDNYFVTEVNIDTGELLLSYHVLGCYNNNCCFCKTP